MQELDHNEIASLLQSAPLARLGMIGPDGPYIIPMPFYFDGEAFYMRLPQRGRKHDCLSHDPRICIEVDGYTPDLTVYWSVIADCVLDPVPEAALIETVRQKNHDKYEQLRGASRKGHGRPKAAPGQSPIRRFAVRSIGGRRSDRGIIDFSTAELAQQPVTGTNTNAA
ncbi:MAG: pyridoxamine 5'-phosphate oxidase family protein [Deltaproteobacteria bacterium]|nr:pyridoxamine 5'-phosphate oxidase family protein [Deltaproteobacteria bacterium]